MSGFQMAEAYFADCHPFKFLNRIAHGGKHLSDLSVFALMDCNLNDC